MTLPKPCLEYPVSWRSTAVLTFFSLCRTSPFLRVLRLAKQSSPFTFTMCLFVLLLPQHLSNPKSIAVFERLLNMNSTSFSDRLFQSELVSICVYRPVAIQLKSLSHTMSHRETFSPGMRSNMGLPINECRTTKPHWGPSLEVLWSFSKLNSAFQTAFLYRVWFAFFSWPNMWQEWLWSWFKLVGVISL